MKKIISIILLAVIISTSVLFTGCGEVASNNAQTSDEADTTVLSDTTPTAVQTNFQLNFMTIKLMNSFQNQTKTTLTKS